MNIVIAGGGFGGVRAALHLARHPKIHATQPASRRTGWRRWANFEWKALRFGGPLGAFIGRFADLLGYIVDTIGL